MILLVISQPSISMCNMGKYLLLLAALIAAACAKPQYAGGSAGGLLEHHGEPLKHEIIGLSRGYEIEHHEEPKYEYHHEEPRIEYQHEEPRIEYHHEEPRHEYHQEEEHRYHHEEGKGGFGGSYFQTPVDIHHEHVVHLKAHPEYHYDYHVADHKHKDFKSKHEERDGYKVKGSYSLLEPDHKTIRVVDYISDKKTGFIAKVSYKKHHQ